MSFMDKIKAKRAAEAAAAGDTAAPAPDASEAAVATAPVEKPKPVAAAAPATSSAQSFKDRLKNKPVAVATKPQEADAAEEPAEAVAAATAVLSPDAPTRETSEERSAELRNEAQAKVDKKKTAAEKKKKPSSKSKHKREFTLYLGCQPTKGEHQGFMMVEDWIQDLISELNAQVLESTKHSDYRLLGYAEEKVALSGAVQAKLEAGDVPSALVCVSSGTAREVANMLIPVASDVVMASK